VAVDLPLILLSEPVYVLKPTEFNRLLCVGTSFVSLQWAVDVILCRQVLHSTSRLFQSSAARKRYKESLNTVPLQRREKIQILSP
jgi:hypothetical protein